LILSVKYLLVSKSTENRKKTSLKALTYSFQWSTIKVSKVMVSTYGTIGGKRMIYLYCRISKPSQKIERQVANLSKAYPTGKLIQEKYTGTKVKSRPLFEKLLRNVEAGDTIVFDSVSRMSRNSKEGIEVYEELMDRGVNLIFLKEPYINTDTYRSQLKDKIELTGTDEDILFQAINEYMKKLARKQIVIAFDQAQKEVDDIRERTREGLREAKKRGSRVGNSKGDTLITKKSIEAKEIIRK
jgi:DNA invertase Pin-like site-specific DNA recombinase